MVVLDTYTFQNNWLVDVQCHVTSFGSIRLQSHLHLTVLELLSIFAGHSLHTLSRQNVPPRTQTMELLSCLKSLPGEISDRPLHWPAGAQSFSFLEALSLRSGRRL